MKCSHYDFIAKLMLKLMYTYTHFIVQKYTTPNKRGYENYLVETVASFRAASCNN